MTLSSDALTSKRLEVAGNVDDAIEACYRQGWTDGLPVIPPTEEKVLQFLDLIGRHPSDVIGVEPVRGRVITAEKVAINAVMAGCRHGGHGTSRVQPSWKLRQHYGVGASAGHQWTSPAYPWACQWAQHLRSRPGQKGQRNHRKGNTIDSD